MKFPLQTWRAKETMMSDDRRKILDMLSQGRLTADEAERLLAALDRSGAGSAGAPTGERPRAGGPGPKYLRVQVSKLRGDGEDKNVNIRVPLQLLKAGVKLPGLLPPKARAELNAALHEKGVGFDLNQLRPDNVDAFIAALSETSIDIDADDGRSRVRVSCE
jgi:hypothetical protein